jgi:LEA14-like dessication related protein
LRARPSSGYDSTMRRLPAAVAALLALSLLASGCAFLSQLLRSAFVQPEVRFKGASLGAVTLSDATLNLTWELQNPNPVGISLASLDYAFFVEGKQVVAGTPASGLRIPPQGTADLSFPATVRFQDIAPVVQTFLEKDYASYRAQGTVGIETPVGVVTLPLQYEGQFEVPKVPRVEFLPPRIQNITFASATVEFPLSVTSRNSYVLPVSASGGVEIAGARVGSLSADLSQVQPRATQRISVPLTINFLEAAQAALALRSGSATVGFKGSLQSGSASIPLQFQQNLTFQR